jgi:hypothetical protein
VDNNEQIRAHMKSAGSHFASVGPCPDTEELLGYHRRTSEAPEREAIESHLVQCAACREKLRDVADFFDDARPEDADMIAPAAVDHEWDRLRSRLVPEARSAPLRMPAARPQPSRLLLALAACLVVALALSATWSLRLARQEVAAQQRLRETQEANRRLQEERDAGRRQLAQLQQPRFNTPIHDVFSSHTLARSGGTSRAKPIAVSSSSPFTLILSGEGVREFPDYELEIVDGQNRSVWKASGLRRGALGNFVVTLNGDFLAPGEYRFRLAGKAASGYQPVAEYPIAIQRLP